jgi:hypothetical protein
VRTLPHAPGLGLVPAAWCRFSQRNRPRRPPCAVLFRSRVSPEHRAPRASGLSRISRDEVFLAPHLTRTSVRSPAAHRRTRHLSGIFHICQAWLTGDNVGPAPIIHPVTRCPQCLVRLGVLCAKPCGDWVCSKWAKSVVHRYSQQVHRLSTDLSFVDNFRPGVQSRSNNESPRFLACARAWAVGPSGDVVRRMWRRPNT